MTPFTEWIPMRQRELHRYHTLRLVADHRITGSEAAQSLGLSLRYVRRLLVRLQPEGRCALVHGNRGRPSGRRLPVATRQQVLALARGKYVGLNTTHLTEKLQADEHLAVSRVTVHRVLRAAGVARPQHRRPPRHRARRERKAQAGLLVLWDGSPHAWLEARGPRCCLVGAMDDATGALLPGAAFVPAEATVSYLRLLRTLVGTCGIPVALYMDRHGIFRRNDSAWTVAEELQGAQEPTQVGRAVAALGIEAIYALSPQAKGRIERLWGTLQDRLVAELRLAGICTVEAANAFLPGFTVRFNARFGRPAGPPGGRSPEGWTSSGSAACTRRPRCSTTTRCERRALCSSSCRGRAAGGTRRRGWRCATCSMGRGGSTTAIGSSPRRWRWRARRRAVSAAATTMALPIAGVTYSQNR